MKKIKIKALNGYIYVESFDGKKNEEPDRAKILDENYNYIDYIPLEVLTKSEYDEVIKNLSSARDFEDFIRYIDACYGYDYSCDLRWLIEAIHDNGDTSQEVWDEMEEDLKLLSDEKLIEKYEINKVGDWYFWICP